MEIHILGEKWTINECTKDEDNFLCECDGYCDKTTKRIVVIKDKSDNELGDWEVYRKKVLRHEIIHAFLFESGLHKNWEHKEYGHEETYVDWIAVQFPKIQKAFEKAGCL